MGINHTISDRLYPPVYARRMQTSSTLGIVAASVAAFCNQYTCAAIATVVTGVSLNHWRDPRKSSVRRKLDIVVVNLSFLYHAVLAYSSSSSSVATVVGLWFGATACYIGAVVIGTGSKAGTDLAYNQASRLHVAFHLFATVANCTLYTLL